MRTRTRPLPVAQKRRMKFVAVMLLLICLAGCGGGSRKQSDTPSEDRAPTSPPEFLFLSLPASNTIAAYQVDAQTGALTQVAGSPFAAAGKAPGEIAAHPSGRFLYGIDSRFNAESTDIGMVSAYSITASGALNPLDSEDINGIAPIALSIDPTGKYVYTVAALSIIPDGYVIDENTGLLTPQSNAPTDYQNRFGAGDVLVLNGFVYESSVGGIVVYRISANGALEEQSFFEPGSGVGPMVLGAHNQFIFGVTGRGDFRPPPDVFPEADIISAAVGHDGSLSMTSTPFKLAASQLAVTENFLFALDPEGIWVFTIDPNTGAFAPVQSSPFPVSNEGGWLQVENSGKFLYLATNNPSGTESTITPFAIDSATGALHSAGPPIALPERVAGLATSTAGSQ